MRILLSAFTCEPGLGSEEGVGWGAAWSLSTEHEVHVLTAPRHRAAIERHLASHPRAGLAFSYFDLPSVLRRLVVTSALWQLYYYLWQCRIATWARPVADRFQPDVVHHVTYGRYWAPSSLWKLGRPFVWGPVGGADNCPPIFIEELTFRERWAERIRPWVQAMAHRDPHVRATARHATVALASTPATARRLRHLGCRHVRPILQMALSGRELEEARAAPRNAPADPIFCSIGKLCGWKGQFLAIRAFALARLPGARLMVLGAGPARPALERLARTLDMAAAIHFCGKLPRAETLAQLAASTALLHPSLHDQAPTVVFEAMALGIPVIALNLAGPAIQLDQTCGCLIEARDPEQAVADMAATMRRLAGNWEECARLGENARRRVAAHFTWEEKARQFRQVYAEAIALHAREAPAAKDRFLPYFLRAWTK